MVDSVIIDGIAPGALSSGLTGLPAWATEITSANILSILRKSFTVQNATLEALVKSASAKAAGNLSPEQTKKLNDELAKLLKNVRDENKEDSKRKKRNKDAEVEDGKENKRRKDDGSNAASSLLQSTLLIKAAQAIENAFVSNVNTFDDLYKSGINVMAGMDGVANGFESLRQMAVLSGVRFTELSAIMQKHSSVINSFGAGKFVKTMSAVSSNLREFGYTTKETGELLGSYLEAQRGYGDVNNKTQREVQKDLELFGKRVTKASLATGMSREAILQNYEAISQSVEANLLAGQVSKEAADSTLLFVSTFKNKQLAQDMLSMMTDVVKPLNNVFQDFAKSGNASFGQMFMAFTQSLEGVDDPDEKKRRLAEFGKLHEVEMNQMIQRNKLLEQAGVKEAGSVNQRLIAIQQESKAYYAISEEERKRLSDTAKASKDFKTAWEKLAASFQMLFVPIIPVMNMLSSGLGVIGKVISGVADTLSMFDGAVKVLTGGLIETAGTFMMALAGLVAMVIFGTAALGKFSGMLSGVLKGIFSSKGAISKTVIGTGGLGGVAGSGAGNASEGLLSGVGKGLASLGKGLAGIGKGIGNAIGSILLGLAKGLTSLGTPKVLLGTLALVGVSGALWVAGAAIKEFVDISWGDLAKAGVAIVGLTVAMLGLGAVMSSGVGTIAILAGVAALGLMGAALWVVGKGIQSLGNGFEMLSNGVASLGSIDALAVFKITTGLVALGAGLALASPMLLVGSVGLLAIGTAAMIAAPGLRSITQVFDEFSKIIIGLSNGIQTLTSINPLKMIAMTGALAILGAGLAVASPLLIVGAAGLSVFGAAANIAAPGIQSLANALMSINIAKDGIQTLTSINPLKMIAMTGALAILGAGLAVASPLLIVGAAGLSVFGAAANIAAPGIQSLANALMSITSVSGGNLIDLAVGLDALTSTSKTNLIAFSLASSVATPGILLLATALSVLAPAVNLNSDGFASFSESLLVMSNTLSEFTGLDTLKSIVTTINGLDVVKALAFGTLASLGVISTQMQSPTTRVSSPISPRVSTIDSVSSNTPAVTPTETAGGTAGLPIPPSKEKKLPGDGLAGLMSVQNAILDKILSSTDSLVAVNKDILRFSKLNA